MHPVVLALLAGASERAAQSEEGHEAAHQFLGIPLGVWQAANLVLFLAFLVYLLRKPLSKFFTERRAGIEKSLQLSEEKRRRTEALAAEIATRLARIETDLAHLRTHAQQEADAEQASLTAQTENDAARIVTRASAEMESRVRTARQELTRYAGDLAVSIARDLVRTNVTPDDQKRLAQEGVVALGDVAPAHRIETAKR